MTINNDQCDFCETIFDPMGNGNQMMVGDKYWCGQCDLNRLTAADYETAAVEKKAAAYDELVKVLTIASQAYWNARPDFVTWDRHYAFLEIEDQTNRIKSMYGLK